MDEIPGTRAESFEVSLKVETHFAWLRTRWSLERTLMAWVRTGTALIAFGFTLFQFLENFNRTPGVVATRHPFAPQVLGLTLIGAGVVSLVIAAFEYSGITKYLWSKPFRNVAGVRETPGMTPLLGLTILLAFAGVFAFLAVLLRFH